MEVVKRWNFNHFANAKEKEDICSPPLGPWSDVMPSIVEVF